MLVREIVPRQEPAMTEKQTDDDVGGMSQGALIGMCFFAPSCKMYQSYLTYLTALFPNSHGTDIRNHRCWERGDLILGLVLVEKETR